MSGVKHEESIDPYDPLYDAPRDLREQATGGRSMAMPVAGRPPLTAEGPPLRPLGSPRRRDNSEMFTKAVAQAMQEAMEPIEVPSALRNRGRRALLSVGVRFSIAAAIAATIALIIVMAISASQHPGVQSSDITSISSYWQSLKASIFPASQRKRAATLIVQDSSGLANDPLPLGVRVDAPPPGAVVAINGLAAGARLTSGKRVAANEWRVPASEISAVSVLPPEAFVGQMLVTAELRDSAGAALVGSSARLSWREAAVVAPQSSPTDMAVAPARSAAASSLPQTEIVRNLDPKEISVLVTRGQDLLASGDIPAARLLLLRAAEGRNARAALLLAKTYDPTMLKQLGLGGPLTDLAQARNWYQKAKEWGEPEAQRQLDALTLVR